MAIQKQSTLNDHDCQEEMSMPAFEKLDVACYIEY
jgi:hypothetical protein